MRAHIAIHILHKDLVGSDICGFCGRDTCTNKCKTKSKKGGIPIFTFDQTDCIYFFDYGRSKVFNKRSNICTNRFDQCPVDGCITEIWKYNFSEHLIEKHPDVDAASHPTWNISALEKKFLLGMKKGKGN